MRAANIARSPCVSQWPLSVQENAVSASLGYNELLDSTDAPVVVFAHHDVYLPAGWDVLLQARIADIEARDPDWAVIGAYGVDQSGVGWGPVWSSSLGQIVGRVAFAPQPVELLDELLIVVRRAAGVRFDPALPGWHMYGTDIAQTAISQGKRVYAGGLPCIHNDGFHGELGDDFDESYRYMQRKWKAKLPLLTPVTTVTGSRYQRLKERYRIRKSFDFRKRMAVGTEHDVEALAAICGWSDLAPSGRFLSRQSDVATLSGA